MYRILWIILVVAISTNLSSPLSPLYQTQYGLSNLAVTALFAVYAVCLLPVLLASGSLERRYGLKRIVTVALLLDLVSLVFFGAADRIWMLFVARIIEGLAVGAFLGAGNALLLRKTPAERAPQAMFLSSIVTMVGFGAGPAFSGLLVQYADLPPRSSPYWLFIPLMLSASILLLGITDGDSPARIRRAAIRIRLGVPASARRLFFRQILPSAFMMFALNGTIIALIPTFVRTVLHSTNLAWSGLILLLLLGGGSFIMKLPWVTEPARRMRAGLLLLIIGSWGTLSAGLYQSMGLLFLGIAIQAAGSGWLFQPGIRLSGLISAPAERSQVISSFYAAAYSGMILPSLFVGVLTRYMSLLPALMWLGIIVSVLAICVLYLSRGMSSLPADNSAVLPAS